MADFDDKNIFSNSNHEEPDPWSIDSLQEDKDIYSSSDHMIHSELFETREELSADPVYSTPVVQEKTVTSDSKKKKAKPKKRSKVGKTFGVFGKVFLSLFLVVVITCSVVGLLGAMWLKNQDNNPDNLLELNLATLRKEKESVNASQANLDFTSLVYAQNAEGKWEEIAALHGEQNRVWIDYTEFSPYLTDAIIAIEDKRFYEHEGVDWKRTFGAFVNTFVDLYGGRQGGSTITQQLVKQLTQDDEISADRKIREILKARKVESNYPKSTIMEWYVNTVYFGNGCHGIGTAARYYFGKEPVDLTLLECAALAATIQTPGAINPIDGPEDNKIRRDACLDIMLEEGMITKAQYDGVSEEELKLTTEKERAKMNVAEKEPNSYFVDALIEDVIADLMVEEDCSYEEAEKMLYSGGYRIYSSLNMEAQEILDETFSDPDNFPTNSEGLHIQCAQTIMDYTGHIVAIAGGVGEKEGDRSLNRAYQSIRQPGSSIKPLAVYGPAVESNLLTYSTLIHDFHVKMSNGGYYPAAAGSGNMVTTQRAIQSSLNSPSARICNTLSPQYCYDFLKKRFGLTTLVESQITEDGMELSDKNLSALALGGMVHGVNVTEMTAAYAAFGNLGQYYEPSTYYAVYDVMGELVLQHQETGSQILMPATAEIMNELMQTVVSGGTGTSASLGSWPVFGKTGTTDNKHDCWFVGGTPYFVSAVWTGYDTDHDLPGGSNPAPIVWEKTMSQIMENLEECDFNRAPDVVLYRYCTETGDIATDKCPSTRTGYYKSSYYPPTCIAHAGVGVSTSKRSDPYGDRYADIEQMPLPEEDEWKTRGVNTKETKKESTEKADKDS